MPLFTVGHSNHTSDYFLSLLRRHDITAICDVRSAPRSRMNPQFDQNELREFLKSNGIEYVFLGASLGARPKERECYKDGRALYSLISETPAFKRSLDRVRKGADSFNLALMCAEHDPITCHRTIMVCRHVDDLSINHILSDGSIESHDNALVRLVKTLGVKGTMTESNRSIINAAYDIQGSRICYAEPNSTQSAAPMEILL